MAMHPLEARFNGLTLGTIPLLPSHTGLPIREFFTDREWHDLQKLLAARRERELMNNEVVLKDAT